MTESKPLLIKWRLLLHAAQDPRLSAACLRALPAVLDRMNDRFECWPGYGRIATDARIDRRTATRAIDRLVELGYLTRNRRGHGVSNMYRIGKVSAVVPIVGNDTSGDNDTSGIGSTAMGVVAALPTGVVSALPPEPESLTRPIEPDPSTQPKGEGLPDWLPAELWAQFQEHRRQLKKPMTDVAKTRAVAKLATLKAEGHEPTDVLDQSIVNGWKGLFAVKGSKTQPAKLPRETQEDFEAAQAETERHLQRWNQ